jgi:hypothetical protein
MAKRRKFGMGKHTSIPDGLRDAVEYLSGHDLVDRVILGRTEGSRNKYPKGSLKFQMGTRSGIKVNGYAPRSVTSIYVLIKPVDKRAEVVEHVRSYRPGKRK